MQRIRVSNLSMSIDGFVAGPDQGLDRPLGGGGERLHQWLFACRSWRRSVGMEGGEEGLDDDFVSRGETGIGATIIGRNMFGPGTSRDDRDWKGWWGQNPPFHHPVFILTHHPRPPLPMEGGTVFHFVTDGIEAALDRAKNAAEGADVRIGGGAETIQQFLRKRLIDELHIALVPILLYRGSRLFANVEDGIEGYECVEFVPSSSVAHIRLAPTR